MSGQLPIACVGGVKRFGSKMALISSLNSVSSGSIEVVVERKLQSGRLELCHSVKRGEGTMSILLQLLVHIFDR